MRGFSRAGATYGLVVCGSCIIGFCLGPSDDLRMHDDDDDWLDFGFLVLATFPLSLFCSLI